MIMGALNEAEVAVEGIVDLAGAPGVSPRGLAILAQIAAHYSKRGQVGLVIVEVESSHGLVHLVLQRKQGQIACNIPQALSLVAAGHSLTALPGNVDLTAGAEQTALEFGRHAGQMLGAAASLTISHPRVQCEVQGMSSWLQ